MQTKTDKSFFQNTLIIVMSAIICTTLWGSASPCIKLSYELFNIESADIINKCVLAGARFTVAGLVVLIVSIVMDKKITFPTKKTFMPLVTLGFLQTTLQYIFFYIGLTYTTGTKGALFSSTNAFIVVLIAPFIFRTEKYTFNKLFGCVLGFAGLWIITVGKDVSEMAGFCLEGEGAVLLASLFFGVSFFVSKVVTKTVSPIVATAWQMIFGGGILLIVSMCMGGTLHFSNFSCVAMLLYLSFISCVAFTLWSILLKYNPVHKISIYGLLTPVFGAVFSAILLGENILTVKNITALTFVCLGIVFVNRPDTVKQVKLK